MQWDQLFVTSRSGSNAHAASTINVDALRTSFIKDYDRIIFSAAFRRLQNKTQVFPLPGTVFVHNRLTHSLEVASVGRSLGKMVGARIATQSDDPVFQDFYKNELANVIAAACLAHDIGNPPFGHSGEDAIRHYFSHLSGRHLAIFERELSKAEQLDFLRYEGNSNALRVLTHAFNEEQSSYNLTLTTLASFLKYPTDAVNGFDKKTGTISSKKSGYFQSEKALFEQIVQTFQLPEVAPQVYGRHPFVYLTEAADDICYRIIDIEDALRLGIVSFDEMCNLFLPFFDDLDGYYARNGVEEGIKKINDTNQKSQYLRARWIGLMIAQVTACFMENEQALLSGTLNDGLLEHLPERFTTLLDEITAFSVKKIYNHKQVVEIEIAGFNVIGALLDCFVTALLDIESYKSKKVLQLIGSQYKIDHDHQSLYQNLLSIVDFITGMTDNYAVDLYKKIEGIEIAGLPHS